VKTIANNILYPNGSNAIVALACYDGHNQEDSIAFDGSANDRGLFTGSHYDYEKSELENGEEFTTPDMATTMDIKQNACYEKLKNGFVVQGTVLEKDDIIIGKVAQIQKPDPDSPYKFIDKSVRYQEREPAVVERVIVSRDHEGKVFCKVKLRAYRPIAIGDKLSSRSGNKGICAIKYQHSDMLFSESGLVPDLIINPHCIPTRMIIGQILESILAKLSAAKGIISDGTAFTKIDINAVGDELEKYGLNRHGNERFFCGMTGEYIDHLVFTCPTYYQRIQKFVIDESCAAVSGPTNASTRQPIEGTSRGGGYKIGEMENWAISAHGSLRCLMQKFFADSDGFTIHICRACGVRSVINTQQKIYKCNRCQQNADISAVSTSWSSKQFIDELSAMGIDSKFKLTPYSYPERE
jgi:DNA-directed RNA polymerase II subunit RPB2